MLIDGIGDILKNRGGGAFDELFFLTSVGW